jgi:hypothetical protein
MNWYIAKLVFAIQSIDYDHKPQFDEQLRLIAAGTLEEAFVKARLLGITNETSFLNTKRKTVRWSFVDVAELKLLQKLTDGLELYSNILEKEEGTRYAQFIHERALALRIEACKS